MRKLVLILVLGAVHTLSFSQKTSSVSGKVTDKQSMEPLPGATITIKGLPNSAIADNEGNYTLPNVNVGQVTLIVSFVGYEKKEVTLLINEGNTNNIDVFLDQIGGIGNEIVVTASKRAERIINAPASIQIIGRKELEQFAGSNVFELFSKVQGIEFTRTGVNYAPINARGFNKAGNNKVFQIVDGRNTMAAVSTGVPLYNLASVNKEDIGQIDILEGPQAALYGPNVNNALFYTTTKDPRIYHGTTVALSAGNQSQFSARFRHAAKIDDRWAYKITGEYVAGKEFGFHDSVYAGNQTGVPPSLYFGDPVAIPEHNVDFDFRHIRGEAHVYYNIAPETDLIVSGGFSENNFLGVTNAGRNQMQGVKPGFLQVRFVHPNIYLNLYNNWGNIGTSYAISSYTRDYWNRTHSIIKDPGDPRYPTYGYLPPDSAEMMALKRNTFTEKNRRFNADGQYNYFFENAGVFLIAGVSYQKEKPNTYGNSLVDRDQRIYVTQAGAVLQLEKLLPWDMRLIGAARFDYHSTQGNFFSPKLALTKKFGENNFRITWARAYSMPSIFFQWANLGGVTFGNGEGVTYLSNPNDAASFKITEKLKPEEVTTWEVGYKGTVATKLYVDVNYYNGLVKNFLGPQVLVTGTAIAVGGIPVKPANSNFFNTFSNYGTARAYGCDAGLNYSFNKNINLAIQYSWFDSDISAEDIENDANEDKYVSLEETSLNAPNHRGLVSLNFQNLCKKRLFVSIATRIVERYDFYSGNQIGTEAGEGGRGKVYWEDQNGQPQAPYKKNFDWGPLGGFATVDVTAGYKFNEMLSVNMGITNLFNTDQIEFVGSPSIGRLIMFELKVHVPNKTKQK